MNESEVYTSVAQKFNYSTSSPLFQRILRKMLAPEEAKLLLELPASTDDLAAKLGLDREALGKKMQELHLRGLVMPTRKGFTLAKDAIQLHDAIMSSADEYVSEGVLDLWRDFRELEFSQGWADWLARKGEPQWRILPTWKSLEASPLVSAKDILPYEDVKGILERAELIAQIKCACRRVLRKCEIVPEVCLQLGKYGEYQIKRGSGIKISADEALSRVDASMERGLVHLGLNTAADPPSLCNCCGDCCAIIGSLQQYNMLAKGLAPSRYQATVDQGLCNGCQVCVDRCLFDAIEMTKVASSKKLKASIDPEKCFGCGECTIKCKPGALMMKVVRPPEHIFEPGRAAFY